MIEAVRSTASAEATWAIVIVTVFSLASWLSMVALANRQQSRSSRPFTSPGPETRPNLPAGAGVPGQRDARAPAGPAPAEPPTRPDLPVHRELPAQRAGEGDRAERSGGKDRDWR